MRGAAELSQVNGKTLARNLLRTFTFNYREDCAMLGWGQHPSDLGQKGLLSGAFARGLLLRFEYVREG